MKSTLILAAAIVVAGTVAGAIVVTTLKHDVLVERCVRELPGPVSDAGIELCEAIVESRGEWR